MAQTTFDTFATSIQETSLWLKSLGRELDAGDSEDLAWGLLTATLHALRDRLRPESAINLGAQLPTLIRGAYYEHWPMTASPTRERHKAQFLEHLQGELPSGATLDAERVARAVFHVMQERVGSGAIAKVTKQLPKELRELWPAAAAS
jgi:uncharacterized protein (DUF2267 family)